LIPAINAIAEVGYRLKTRAEAKQQKPTRKQGVAAA